MGTAVAGHGPLPTPSTLIVALYQSLPRPAAHDPSSTLRMLRRLLHVSRHQLPLLAARPPKATYSNCDSPSSARSTTRSFAWRSSQTRDCSIWLVCHSRSKMGTPSSSFPHSHHRCIFQHHLFPAPPRCQEIKATIMRPHRRPTASSCCVVPGPLPLHQKTALRPFSHWENAPPVKHCSTNTGCALLHVAGLVLKNRPPNFTCWLTQGFPRYKPATIAIYGNRFNRQSSPGVP